MNAFDIAVLVVAGVLALIGLLKGVVRILVGIGALIVAFLLASRFHQRLADLWVEEPSRWLRVGAYVAIFLGVMLVGAWIAWLLRALFKAAMLGWADRLAGAALGLAAAAVGTALLIMPLVAYVPRGESVLTRSVLAPYLVVVSDLFNRLAPEDMRQHFRGGIDELRKLWGQGAERASDDLDPSGVPPRGGESLVARDQRSLQHLREGKVRGVIGGNRPTQLPDPLHEDIVRVPCERESHEVFDRLRSSPRFDLPGSSPAAQDLGHLEIDEVRGVKGLAGREPTGGQIGADGGIEQHFEDRGGVDDDQRPSRSARTARAAGSRSSVRALAASRRRNSATAGRSATRVISASR